MPMADYLVTNEKVTVSLPIRQAESGAGLYDSVPHNPSTTARKRNFTWANLTDEQCRFIEWRLNQSNGTTRFVYRNQYWRISRKYSTKCTANNSTIVAPMLRVG